MDPNQLGTSRLVAERSLHIFERRLEHELRDQYQYFKTKPKGLEHRDPVDSLKASKHVIVYQSSSLQGNKFHDNFPITTESNDS